MDRLISAVSSSAAGERQLFLPQRREQVLRQSNRVRGALVYLAAYVLLNPLRPFVTVNDPFGSAETLIQ